MPAGTILILTTLPNLTVLYQTRTIHKITIAYSYARNNPVKYTDPTGHISCTGPQWDEPQCVGTQAFKDNMAKEKVVQSIYRRFKNITIKDVYKLELRDLQEINAGLSRIVGGNGFNRDMDASFAAFGDITFIPVALGSLGSDPNTGLPIPARANWENGEIKVAPNADATTIIHEMGHILDGSLKRNDKAASLRSETFGNVFNTKGLTTDYGRTDHLEDFADSFLAVITYGTQSQSNPAISDARIAAITALIQSYTNADYTSTPR